MPLLNDSFTDTNGTALASHAMDVGPGWFVPIGSLEIQSNKARATTDLSVNTALVDATAANAVTSVDVAVPSGNTSLQVLGRVQDTNNHWWLSLEDSGSGMSLKLYEKLIGADTVRDGISVTGISGTTQTITLTMNGTTISGSIGGFTVGYSSSLFQTETIFGIQAFVYAAGSFPQQEFDNFLVSAPGGGGGAPANNLFYRRRR